MKYHLLYIAGLIMKFKSKKFGMTIQFVCWLLCVFFVSEIRSQENADSYEVEIAEMSYKEVHKNWLLVPKTVDVQVRWVVTSSSQLSGSSMAHDPNILPFVYQMYTYKSGTNTQPEITEIARANRILVKDLQVGQTYTFKVRVFDAQSQLIAESNSASIVVGAEDSKLSSGAISQRSLLYYLNPGRWQLSLVGKSSIYDRSTQLGKVAFIFLSFTSFMSCLILFFYSSRTLYLGNIFPFERSMKNLIWSMVFSCDTSYSNRLSKKFKFILKAWENTASKSKFVADKAVKNIPASLSSTEKMASVDVACMEYWMTDGDRAIETIEDILSFPYDTNQNGVSKSSDELLTNLVIKIEDSFHDILSDPANSAAENVFYEKEDMKKLIEDIYDPVVKEERAASRIWKYILRKGVFDMRSGLRPFPTSRIIHAGLGIHRMNGYRWFKPTEEVKRAFEDRASNEIDLLKRKSKIEWFWNYGALAPLVGLFGTVTGITYAFQQLSKSVDSPDFSNTIQMLSNGIFEALWTTIFGLANGIFFVIIFYYYKHKLDWIYAKWEELYVTITEKL